MRWNALGWGLDVPGVPGRENGGRAMKGWETWSRGRSPRLWENGGAAGAAWVRRAVCAHTKSGWGRWGAGAGEAGEMLRWLLSGAGHAGMQADVNGLEGGC